MSMNKRFNRGSWEKVAPWYNRLTDDGRGHYYHQHVVIPGVLRLLDLNSKPSSPNPKLVDIACGNGVLAQALPKNVEIIPCVQTESGEWVPVTYIQERLEKKVDVEEFIKFIRELIEKSVVLGYVLFG